jgi:pre-mRNA-processing factor 19
LEIKEDGMDFINSISFSENGYHLASCSEEDDVVRIWDIRKNSVVKYVNLPENSTANKVQFDPSGNLLGIAGHVVSIYNIKNSELVNYDTHKNISTSINFEKTKNVYFVSTSLDGDIKLFA